MTINNATAEQINVALLDLDKRIKALNIDNEAIKSLQNSVKTIKSSLNETKAGLQSGATYDINISGNASTATKAVTATTAEIVNSAASADEANHAVSADTATNANHAETATTADAATNANLSKTLDTVNGDKLQIGSGTAQNITNAKHAASADAFSTTYTSMITPAQAAAMKSRSTIWPLSYNKDYLQTVTVTWDDYSSHTFPAGAAGMFFPGYSSNGGTLILINYESSRMLYNVWVDSNRWSGWHYIDLPAISYT